MLLATLRQITRFLVSGGCNTLLTWGVYASLLHVLPYRISYTLAYGIGIALAYVLSRYYVFRRSSSNMGFLWIIGIYVCQYLIGLLFISVWVQILKAPAVWAPLFSTALSLPAIYLLSARVFRERRIDDCARNNRNRTYAK